MRLGPSPAAGSTARCVQLAGDPTTKPVIGETGSGHGAAIAAMRPLQDRIDPTRFFAAFMGAVPQRAREAEALAAARLDDSQALRDLCSCLGLPEACAIALGLCVREMRAGEVMRSDGDHYATHPIRLALLLSYAFEGGPAPACVNVALLHDQLEESRRLKRDVHGFRSLQADIAEWPDAAAGAILLSEPQLDFDGLVERLAPRGVEVDKRGLVKGLGAIAYACQVGELIPASFGRQALTDAAIADKIVNLFDFGYVTEDPKKTVEQKRSFVEAALGKYAYTRDRIVMSGSPPLVELYDVALRHLSEAYVQRFGARLGKIEWFRQAHKELEAKTPAGDTRTVAEIVRGQIRRWHSDFGWSQ